MRSAHLPLAVGRPIKVKQKDHPSTADLEEVQERYIAELKRSVPVLELSPSPRLADLVTDASSCSPAGSGRTTRRCTPRAAPRSSPSLRDARRRRKSTYPRRCSRLVAAVVPAHPFRAPFTFCAPLLHTALLACSEQCPPSLALERLVARRAVLLRALAASREPESPESARPDKHSCSRPLRDAQRVVKLRPCLAAEDSSEAGRPAGTGKPWSAGRLH